MYMDADLIFSDDQAILGVGVASTNDYDASAAADIGKGEEMRLVILVTENFAGGTDLDIDLQTDDNSGFSSAKSIPLVEDALTAALLAGTVLWDAPLPTGLEQFTRLYYTPNGTYTAGKLKALLVRDSATWVALPGNTGS